MSGQEFPQPDTVHTNGSTVLVSALFAAANGQNMVLVAVRTMPSRSWGIHCCTAATDPGRVFNLVGRDRSQQSQLAGILLHPQLTLDVFLTWSVVIQGAALTFLWYAKSLKLSI